MRDGELQINTGTMVVPEKKKVNGNSHVALSNRRANRSIAERFTDSVLVLYPRATSKQKKGRFVSTKHDTSTKKRPYFIIDHHRIYATRLRCNHSIAAIKSTTTGKPPYNPRTSTYNVGGGGCSATAATMVVFPLFHPYNPRTSSYHTTAVLLQ